MTTLADMTSNTKGGRTQQVGSSRTAGEWTYDDDSVVALQLGNVMAYALIGMGVQNGLDQSVDVAVEAQYGPDDAWHDCGVAETVTAGTDASFAWTPVTVPKIAAAYRLRFTFTPAAAAAGTLRAAVTAKT